MNAQNKPTVSFAGSGNVGSFLAVELFKAGCTIKQVYSRTLENAKILAEKVDAEPIDRLDLINIDIQLLIVALPDKVIPEFCATLSNELSTRNSVNGITEYVKPELWVASTAGSVMLDEFKLYFFNSGVLYPLQS